MAVVGELVVPSMGNARKNLRGRGELNGFRAGLGSLSGDRHPPPRESNRLAAWIKGTRVSFPSRWWKEGGG